MVSDEPESKATGPEPGMAGALDRLRGGALSDDARRARERNRAALFGSEPPRVAGKYVLGECIGRGGLGSVYRARDETLQRDVAIKFLRASRMERGAREFLLREARALARLSHPNVVGIHEFGTSDEDVFLVMELVEGETLASWIQQKRRPWREVLGVFMQAGRGLEAAHAQGIVHGDFKPQNVVLGREGRARVVDFGLAREQVPHEVETTTPTAKGTGFGGTPGYLAPELFEGRVDARSDQFAFCVALHVALYGLLPFPETASRRELLDLVQTATVRTPSKPVSVPKWLRSVILRGLKAAPDERYPAMGHLLDALRGPRRRRAIALGLAAAGGFAAWQLLAPGPCQPKDDPIAEVWNDAQREDLAQTQQAVAAGLIDRLDAYANTWRRRRKAYCQAFERGELEATEYTRRQTCMHRSARRVGVWLRDVNESAVDTAMLVGSLEVFTDPEACERAAAVIEHAPESNHELGQAIYRGIDEAHVALELGRYEVYRDRLEAIGNELGDLSAAPGHALWLRYQLAMAKLHLGELEGAEQELRQVHLDAERQDATPIIRGNAMGSLAAILSQRGNGEEARRLAETAIAVLSSHGNSRQHLLPAKAALALAHEAVGEPEAALAIVAEAQREPMHPTTPLTVGLTRRDAVATLRAVEARALEQLGRADDAEQAYGAGLHEFGWSLDGEGNIAEGLRHPTAATLLHNFGVFEKRRGQLTRSADALTHAARIRSGLGLWREASYSWLSLANTSATVDLEAALEAFAEAEKLIAKSGIESDLVEVWYNRAIAYQLAGKHEPALADYNRVIQGEQPRKTPRQIRYGARIGGGSASLALGDAAGARRAFEDALELEPAKANAQDRLELRIGMLGALRETENAARIRRLAAEVATLSGEVAEGPLVTRARELLASLGPGVNPGPP